ncbi:MAG: CopG family transcriptional regulator [Candidatus Melainabacteria bacterium RIFCSPLOWO2_12_FULL_35_11]|nr:MAG: CopG family transcriptional regulator [Candidatus Melainabacteria bacterium RIFCSPLOWO2_12_FULL_35_11]
MKKKTIKYTDESINARVIKDFLPKPEDLVFKEDNVKVTLSLSKKSVNFFKQQSEKFHTHYQTMIRLLLDQYAENFK